MSFFDWAIREAGLPGNPARALTTPKARDVDRKTFTESFVRKVLAAQDYVGDWVLAYLILRYGLRRSGIQNIQLKHFDFEARELTVHTKGARVYPIPIVEAKFWRRLGELQLEAQLGEDDYLRLPAGHPPPPRPDRPGRRDAAPPRRAGRVRDRHDPHPRLELAPDGADGAPLVVPVPPACRPRRPGRHRGREHAPRAATPSAAPSSAPPAT